MVELSLWLLQRYLTAIRKDFLVSSSVSCETVIYDNSVGAYYLRGTAAYHHVQVSEAGQAMQRVDGWNTGWLAHCS